MNNLCCLVNPHVICACGGHFCYEHWFDSEKIEGVYHQFGNSHVRRTGFFGSHELLGICNVLKAEVKAEVKTQSPLGSASPYQLILR